MILLVVDNLALQMSYLTGGTLSNMCVSIERASSYPGNRGLFFRIELFACLGIIEAKD